MKESIGSNIPPSGHIYTAEEVRVRLSRIGSSGFSGNPPPDFDPAWTSMANPSDHLRQEMFERYKHPIAIAGSKEEGFMTKGIRELKEYFLALFVKTADKKEIEHGK